MGLLAHWPRNHDARGWSRAPTGCAGGGITYCDSSRSPCKKGTGTFVRSTLRTILAKVSVPFLHKGQCQAFLVLVLAFLVGIAGAADRFGAEEQDLGDALAGVHL